MQRWVTWINRSELELTDVFESEIIFTAYNFVDRYIMPYFNILHGYIRMFILFPIAWENIPNSGHALMDN